MSLSDSGLPESLKVELRGPVAMLRLSRPHKRNAVDNVTIAGIERFFADLPSDVRAVVIHGEGEHFCAGLDLNTVAETDATEGDLALARLAPNVRAD